MRSAGSGNLPDLPFDLEGLLDTEVLMEFADVVGSHDIGKGNVVIENIVGAHRDGFVKAVGTLVAKKRVGDFNRGG